MRRIKMLYSSGEVHSAIQRLLGHPSSTDKRVVLVAYVGSDGDAYLPHPAGLRLICSPSPGATDPETLGRMITRGARVEFSDKLHMKVYWSKNRGCILTSANASNSALGMNGLKETGIWLPPGHVRINALIKYAKPYRAELKALSLLSERSREIRFRAPRQVKARAKKKQFPDWYRLQIAKWKLCWGDEERGGTATSVKTETVNEYGLKQPHGWASVGLRRVRRANWLLTFTLTNRGLKSDSVEWLLVNFIVKLSSTDGRYYSRQWPCHAVQVHPLSWYSTPPPFAITAKFRSVLGEAINRYSQDRIKKAKSDNPPKQLLKIIAELY